MENMIASFDPIGDDESRSGHHRINFTLYVAGTYQLLIILDGRLISPQRIVCHPGHTSASWSGVRDIPQTIQAGAGALSTLSRRFHLQARDEFNNTINLGGDIFRVQLRGAGLVPTCFDSEHQRQNALF